jgi:hypothetical protein
MVLDIPRWRDQCSKGGWHEREAHAEGIAGKLADRHKAQPSATLAQPYIHLRSGH